MTILDTGVPLVDWNGEELTVETGIRPGAITIEITGRDHILSFDAEPENVKEIVGALLVGLQLIPRSKEPGTPPEGELAMTDFEITYRGARLDQVYFEKYTPGEKIAWKAGVDAALGDGSATLEERSPEETVIANGFGEIIARYPSGKAQPSHVNPVQLRTWVVGPNHDRSEFLYTHLIEVAPGHLRWAETHAEATKPDGDHSDFPFSPDSDNIHSYLGHWDLVEITPGVEFTVSEGFHEPAAERLVDVQDGMHLVRDGDEWSWKRNGTRGDPHPWGWFTDGGYTFRVLEVR